MQLDNEIGKVALATPILICKSISYKYEKNLLLS